MPALEELHSPHIESEHAFIDIKGQGDGALTTQWIDSRNKFFERIQSNKEAQSKLCYIYNAAINQRDVDIVYGRSKLEVLLEHQRFDKQEQNLGIEFAGRLRDGSRVMGIAQAQTLATSVVCSTERVWPVPGHWSLEDAGTVPFAYATAYCALVLHGRIKRDDKVLDYYFLLIYVSRRN